MLRVNQIPLNSFIGIENSDSVVLFVHGLAGSYNTWEHFTKHLKNKWNEPDGFELEYADYYKKSNILFFRKFYNLYYVLKGASIESLSEHLGSIVSQNCEKYENVILVGHSMGGLVARKYIVDQLKNQRDLGKVKGLITYATPNKGTILANYFEFIIKNPLPFIMNPFALIGSKQIFSLKQGSPFIEKLNKDWRNMRINDKIDFKRVGSEGDTVVNIDSSLYEKNKHATLIVNKSHFDIIKPDQHLTDTAFMVLYNYLKSFRKNLIEKQEYDDQYESYTQDEGF
jgi:hypothetical protein